MLVFRFIGMGVRQVGSGGVTGSGGASGRKPFQVASGSFQVKEPQVIGVGMSVIWIVLKDHSL
jgi:hypothetical protein